jgi:hypothetical protein
MMHLGTNDVWSGIAPGTILKAFSNLVDQMRKNNSKMKILVSLEEQKFSEESDSNGSGRLRRYFP